MRYVIKEKFWSMRDTFHVFNEQKEPVLQILGKVFSWGDNLSVQSMDGEEQAVISQTLFSFKPRYQITRGGRAFAEVVKEWSWFDKTFTLDVPGPNDDTIEGSFWQHDFTFMRSGSTVAKVNKTHWSWSDTYGVEIVDGEDDISILCACIVIDQVLHDGKD